MKIDNSLGFFFAFFIAGIVVLSLGINTGVYIGSFNISTIWVFIGSFYIILAIISVIYRIWQEWNGL